MACRCDVVSNWIGDTGGQDVQYLHGSTESSQVIVDAVGDIIQLEGGNSRIRQ